MQIFGEISVYSSIFSINMDEISFVGHSANHITTTLWLSTSVACHCVSDLSPIFSIHVCPVSCSIKGKMAKKRSLGKHLRIISAREIEAQVTSALMPPAGAHSHCATDRPYGLLFIISFISFTDNFGFLVLICTLLCNVHIHTFTPDSDKVLRHLTFMYVIYNIHLCDLLKRGSVFFSIFKTIYNICKMVCTENQGYTPTHLPSTPKYTCIPSCVPVGHGLSVGLSFQGCRFSPHSSCQCPRWHSVEVCRLQRGTPLPARSLTCDHLDNI